jgi:hypothetical protein
MVDTDKCKDMVYYRLGQAMEQGPQAAYLHRQVGEDYARQILAEEQRRDRRGLETWVQVATDNHYLDCEVLCHLVAEPEWPGGGINLFRPRRRRLTGGKPGGPRVVKSKFMSR